MLFLLPLFLFSFPLVLCTDLPELTNDNFAVRVKEKAFTLVMFYAPWCGHCKQFKPHFKSAGKRLIEDTDNVALALVDCTTQDKICANYDIKGYPTVKLFQDGAYVHDFDGDRTESGVIRYMLQRSKPSSIELLSASDLTGVLDSKDAKYHPVVISFIKTGDEEWMTSFKSISTSFLGIVVFAHSRDPSVIGADGDKNILRLYRPKHLHTIMEDSMLEFDGDLSVEAVRKWIEKTGHGMVAYRSPDNERIFPKKNLLVFYHNSSLENYPKGVNYYRNRLIKLIQGLKIDLDMVYTYSCSEDFGQELSDFQLSPGSGPYVVIYSDSKRYLLDSYSPEALTDFLEKFHSKSLAAFIKSEPIPAEQKGATMTVVGHTFDSVVNDPTKDVFIVFHAPWCGHCKNLLPKFESAAEIMKDEPSLILAKYDATANELFEQYKVTGYPTLYFVPKNKKQTPMRYEGGRELDDFIKFVARESTEELRGYSRSGEEKKLEL